MVHYVEGGYSKMKHFLFIGAAEQARLVRLLEYAKANLWPEERITAGHGPWPGEIPEHVASIQRGFRIVFSIEQHPSGWFRHASISVSTPGKYPSPQAVRMISRYLGYLLPLESMHMYIDNDAEAINIMEPYHD